MDHLQQMRAFVAVAEHGGFARAARVLSISAPAATRAVAALEQRFGVLLLQRTTRSLRLTEQGQAYFADCQRILGDLDATEATLTGAHHEPQGTLSVTAPGLFGSRHIAPLIFEFLDRHPTMRARTLFTNRLVHLVDEGFDVALRIAVLPDSGLTAVPVGHMRAVVVASPEYLNRHGVPRALSDLETHRAIGLAIEGQTRFGWSFGRQGSHSGPQEHLIVNSNEVKVAAAVASQGLARVLEYQVVDEVRDGRLRIVLQDHEARPVPVHLVYPAGRAAVAKVREFVRFAAERLSAMPVLRGQGLDATITDSPLRVT